MPGNEHPLPPEELPCGCCGAQRIIIRTHVTKRVEMEEAKLYVVEEVRYTVNVKESPATIAAGTPLPGQAASHDNEVGQIGGRRGRQHVPLNSPGIRSFVDGFHTRRLSETIDRLTAIAKTLSCLSDLVVAGVTD